MNLNQAFIVAVFVMCIGCQSENKNAVAGLWKLYSMELKDTTTGEWSNWRDGMQGYLLYDDQNHVALHLMPVGYEENTSDFKNFTDTQSVEKLKHLAMNYNYTGRYAIDTENNIVKHLRLSHSNPNDWGVEVERRFSFSGDTLIITPVERKNALLRLKWLRD